MDGDYVVNRLLVRLEGANDRFICTDCSVKLLLRRGICGRGLYKTGNLFLRSKVAGAHDRHALSRQVRQALQRSHLVGCTVYGHGELLEILILRDSCAGIYSEEKP